MEDPRKRHAENDNTYDSQLYENDSKKAKPTSVPSEVEGLSLSVVQPLPTNAVALPSVNAASSNSKSEEILYFDLTKSNDYESGSSDIELVVHDVHTPSNIPVSSSKAAVVSSSSSKIPCSYGLRCYYMGVRSHVEYYSHPKREKPKQPAAPVDPRPLCTYGSRCLYKSEIGHSRKFKHTSAAPAPVVSATKEKQKVEEKKESKEEREKREKEWARNFRTTEDLRLSSSRTMSSIHEEHAQTEEEIYKGLAEKQKYVLSEVSKGNNIFYTGPAGTGKSFLLKRIISLCKLQRKWVAVTASTGVAATNIGGMTIHSWSGIGLGDKKADETFYMIRARKNLVKEWQRTNVLIIDEISMISAEILDLLDQVGRSIRSQKLDDGESKQQVFTDQQMAINAQRPFGGIQVILVGDFYQLPPVFSWKKERIAYEEEVKKNPNTKLVMPTRARFAFESDAWKSLNLKRVGLTEVFRQEDQAFVNLLNSLRNGVLTEESERVLKGSTKPLSLEDKILPTKLYPDNREVDHENDSELRKLPGESKEFLAMDTIYCDKADWFKSSVVPKDLHLKVGAQVMLLSNVDTSEKLVNGSRGVVIGFVKSKDLPEPDKKTRENRSAGVDLFMDEYEYLPVVKFCSGRISIVMPESFYVETGGSLRAKRVQLPLKMAWALTVHKSQGMTLDKVELTMEKAFAAGQAYVALSRCRTLEGIYIKSFPRSCVKADEIVLKWYQENPLL